MQRNIINLYCTCTKVFHYEASRPTYLFSSVDAHEVAWLCANKWRTPGSCVITISWKKALNEAKKVNYWKILLIKLSTKICFCFGPCDIYLKLWYINGKIALYQLKRQLLNQCNQILNLWSHRFHLIHAIWAWSREQKYNIFSQSW